MKKIVIKDKQKFIRNTYKISCLLLLAITFLLISIISPILANLIQKADIQILTRIIYVILVIICINFVFFRDKGGVK